MTTGGRGGLFCFLWRRLPMRYIIMAIVAVGQKVRTVPFDFRNIRLP